MNDLYLRLTKDVLNKNPDIVVIWVGVNDVWHKGFGSGTEIDKFEKYYVSIIQRLQEKNIKLVLATPAAIGEKKNGSNQFDADLDTYCNVIRRLAKDSNCKLVDIRKLFIEYEKIHNTGNEESGILTTDKVHLTDLGNQLVADEMIKVIVQ